MQILLLTKKIPYLNKTDGNVRRTDEECVKFWNTLHDKGLILKSKIEIKDPAPKIEPSTWTLPYMGF